jgi:DNA-binding transcriptional LysR family regulator
VSYLDTPRMRSFVMVAQELNITRAAARLHMSQQAVSLHVQQLERSLGVSLLVRNGKGVELTPAGRELAASGAGILGDLDALAQRVRSAARRQGGTLRLAAGFASRPVVYEIADRMEQTTPGTQVEITFVQSQTDGVRMLAGGDVDAAVMWHSSGLQRFRHLAFREDRRMVALSASHPLAGGPGVNLAELADHPVVIPDIYASDNDLRAWICDPRPDGARAVRGPGVPGIAEALMAVARGRGVFIAPEPVRQWFQIPGVVWVPLVDAPSVPAAVIWPSGPPSPLVRTLIASARALTAEAEALAVAD